MKLNYSKLTFNLKLLIKCLLTLIILQSCNNSSVSPIRNDNILNIHIDTLKIKINTKLLPYYALTGYNKSQDKFYAYNGSNHSIDVFSIGEGLYLQSLVLESEGPNYVESPNELCMLDNGDIYTIGYFDITKLNALGGVIKRQQINSKSDDGYFKTHFFYPSQDNGFEYDTKTDMFYIKNTNMEAGKSLRPETFYSQSKVIGSYTFNMKEAKVLEIYYPTEFTEKDFGFNDIPFFTISEGFIYYSFSPLPYIFKYNLNTQETIKVKVPTEGLPLLKMDYPAISKNNNTGKSFNSFVFNSNFGVILSNEKYVARLYHSASLPIKESNPGKMEKESYVQIFDKDINLIKNIKLDISAAFSGSFMNSDAIFVQMSPDNEDELSFLKISINN